jgi:hypothetical protein
MFSGFLGLWCGLIPKIQIGVFMANKRKLMVDSILYHINRINGDVQWRPEGNSADLGRGLYIWNEDFDGSKYFNPSIERYSRNSCVYPDIDQYSSVEDIENTIRFLSEKEVQVIVDLLKKSN